MKIDMVPHSGVLAWVPGAHEWEPFPVVGWYTHQTVEGGLALQPLILRHGRMEVLADALVEFSLVGLTEMWFDVVAYHNADNRLGGGARAGR